MAARKIRQPPADLVETPRNTGPTSRVAPTTGDAVPRSRQLWLWPPLLLFAVWFVCLVTLAWRTANPVTLNREQILRADIVVEARVDTLATGECRIERSWPDAPQLGPVITVTGLADLFVRPGQTYLLPLERDDHGGGFHVVTTPPPLSKPLVYPADDQARRQLAEVLGAAVETAANTAHPREADSDDKDRTSSK